MSHPCSTTCCRVNPKRAVIAVDIVGKLAAWHLLYHRPASAIRGPKWAWFAATLIPAVGPLAFLCYGRRVTTLLRPATARTACGSSTTGGCPR